MEKETIESDPKKSKGALKPPLHLLPPTASLHHALAMGCGAKKYGQWNWRHNKVEIMTYVGAIRRHLDAFVESESLDPESGASHLGHIMAGCSILLDADSQDMLIDNRPPQKTNH